MTKIIEGVKQKISPRKISGIADYNEYQNFYLGHLESIAIENFKRYGFTRLYSRPLELREVLVANGGIQKQIFGVSRLQNDKATDLALPFDRTVPFAVWVVRNARDITFPFKRFDSSYSFRGERAQAGRFQAFIQTDIDIIGDKFLDSSADSECISVLFNTIESFNIGSAYLCVNNIRLVNSILDKFGIYENREDVLREIDKLLKVSKEEVVEEIVKLGLDEKTSLDLVNIFSYQGDIENFIAKNEFNTPEIKESVNELEEVISGLKLSGISEKKIKFTPSIVRGLNYYTGTVFETFLEGFENYGSISSGGRYDNLASTFTDLKLPGVGGSIGLTRLFDIICQNNLLNFERKTIADILVAFRVSSLRNKSQEVAQKLRAKGFFVDLYCGDGSIKKQLSYGNAKGFSKAVLVMDNESFVYKDLSSGEQIEFKNIDDLVNYIIGGK
ncbi:MAG: HisS family protein [Candidatus Sericytochromatia bacterium]